MSILPALFLLTFASASIVIVSNRAAILARPNGKTIFTVVQTALSLLLVAFLCWQFFAIGFQSGGDIARRDARAEARAAALT